VKVDLLAQGNLFAGRKALQAWRHSVLIVALKQQIPGLENTILFCNLDLPGANSMHRLRVLLRVGKQYSQVAKLHASLRSKESS
jgi:hypothetical protein